MNETSKFNVVLVYKLDRLSRSQRDTLYLIEEIFLPHNVDFVSMQESFDTSSPLGKAMIGLLAVFAQLEREQIKERTMMGRKARAKEGFFHGGKYAPFGYDYKDGKLHVNPYEAEQVRKIFNWYLDGLSYRHIADNLTAEGYLDCYGNSRSWSTVRKILLNETYTGRIKFDDIIANNAHEAIISKEQFQAVQNLHTRRKEYYGKHGFQSQQLLTGILFCGFCGARYYKQNVGAYSYYRCYSRLGSLKSMVKDSTCKNKTWKASELEGLIKSRIRELLMSPQMAKDIITSNQNKSVVVNNDTLKIERRIREIDKQIAKLMDLYQVYGIPAEILGTNINKLYHEKISLESTLKPVEKTELTPFSLIEELIKDAAQVWDFSDDSQKRRIIQGLVNRITLTGDSIDIEWSF